MFAINAIIVPAKTQIIFLSEHKKTTFKMLLKKEEWHTGKGIGQELTQKNLLVETSTTQEST